jgi:hypothetical protein
MTLIHVSPRVKSLEIHLIFAVLAAFVWLVIPTAAESSEKRELLSG